mmetsp:Transcript_6748/g.8207  ORF Transcript_6748/g.8207 Transcript_6748/m.8207 type:complete len:150 (-) Transcript_6748:226-675(-)|eukprot:CAMPEP_0195285586 /NCGR_PEP_ID=MMETSP0707-20130614/3366_1 /TAXON_ID=33640 /ORGANISM="Asterionellopsis glacialis, Strain CCMP134" /LENGTH=149 /DNA_ID=CAMNT_0040345103 /DNA_START=95 /DNA_END=544 /DNA_ORIENTATION=-
MAPVESEAIAKAKASTIWKTCFQDMKWEKWDPDVVEVTNIQNGGFMEGGTFDFVMKEGPVKVIPCTISNFQHEKSITFSGSAMGGLLSFSGTIELTPQENDNETKVYYTFALSGCLGSIVSFANPKPIVAGTENGLANIVRLSEEAETK